MRKLNITIASIATCALLWSARPAAADGIAVCVARVDQLKDDTKETRISGVTGRLAQNALASKVEQARVFLSEGRPEEALDKLAEYQDDLTDLAFSGRMLALTAQKLAKDANSAVVSIEKLIDQF